MKALLKLSVIGVLGASLFYGVAISGCGKTEDPGTSGTGAAVAGGSDLSGKIDVDGSSTVEPISSAMAEEFLKEAPKVEVTVAASGTGGGFKKFAAGEIAIAGASRMIEEDEIKACADGGVEWVEIPIAYDGLSVVVNPENDFVDDITVEELKKIWEPNSKVKMWSDVRPSWPKEEIKLYGAGTDSGTFDYFTKAIVGEEGASRKDYQPSEDDNVLVQGVAGDKYALGYFGYAYFEQNKDKLKLLKINGIAPSPETVADGSYKPLSRPLFIYANKKMLSDAQVMAFVNFYLDSAKDLIPSVGYVALPDAIAEKVKAHVKEMKTGPSNLLSSGS